MARDTGEYELVKGMAHWDRRVLFLEMELESEQARLDMYIDQYKDIGLTIESTKRIARDDVLGYTDTQTDEDLVRVEQSADTLAIIYEWRDGFRQDIREQRERVQWLRQELQEVKAKMARLMLS